MKHARIERILTVTNLHFGPERSSRSSLGHMPVQLETREKKWSRLPRYV